MIRILYNAMVLDEFEAGQRLAVLKNQGVCYTCASQGIA